MCTFDVCVTNVRPILLIALPTLDDCRTRVLDSATVAATRSGYGAFGLGSPPTLAPFSRVGAFGLAEFTTRSITFSDVERASADGTPFCVGLRSAASVSESLPPLAADSVSESDELPGVVLPLGALEPFSGVGEPGFKELFGEAFCGGGCGFGLKRALATLRTMASAPG